MQGTADDGLPQSFESKEGQAPAELCDEVLLTEEHLAEESVTEESDDEELLDEEPAADSGPDATEVSYAIARWDTTFRLALLRTTGKPAFWFFLTAVVCSHR